MPIHGTLTMYVNSGCRCTECKSASAEYARKRREIRAKSPVPDEIHGTRNGYVNYSCRCRLCSIAESYYQDIRNSKKEEA